MNVELTLILFFGITLYFLPWLIALIREHHQATAIGLLNLLLGWTFIGWVVSLVWSATKVDES